MHKLEDTAIIFTYPNNDEGSEMIIKMIKSFVKNKTNTYLIKSLGFTNYISLVKHVDCVVGNSSSGIFEVPFLKKHSLNIVFQILDMYLFFQYYYIF